MLFLRSSGGGTGSGLGSKMIGEVSDRFPSLLKFDCPVFPSAHHSDVITEPYNALFSTREGLRHADCLIPFDNSALENSLSQFKLSQGQNFSTSEQESTFQGINRSISQVLSTLTCSSRFHGELNLDFTDIATNLVPFPALKILSASMSPLHQQLQRPAAASSIYSRDSLDIHFSDCIKLGNQVLNAEFDAKTISKRDEIMLDRSISVHPALQYHNIISSSGADFSSQCHLASCFISRGTNVTLGQARRGLQRILPLLPLTPSRESRVKLAVCSAPSVQPGSNTIDTSASILGHGYSVLMLSNDCQIRFTIQRMRESFRKLYRQKAHVHHFTQYCELAEFDDALEETMEVVKEYAFHHQSAQKAVVDDLPTTGNRPRLTPTW